MPSPDPDRRATAYRDRGDPRTDRAAEPEAGNQPPTPGELNAMWRMHRLESPTFDDFTRGLCLGLVWCMALWTPMFISALA
ncbi:hypothetical protein ABMY26_24935 [Azospirillum sp. HJ39]|uniref:hypothetical protein n=1 Tax=Azospirillum sp. HJ39 TaxID=3159496 RepID=UPI003556BCAC